MRRYPYGLPPPDFSVYNKSVIPDDIPDSEVKGGDAQPFFLDVVPEGEENVVPPRPEEAQSSQDQPTPIEPSGEATAGEIIEKP